MRNPEVTMTARFAFDAADELARQDFGFSRPLGPGDEVRVAAGSGTGSIDVFDCSDVEERVEDVDVWAADRGTLSVDAVYLEDHPEWTCEGTGDNPLYALTWTLSDATFTNTVDGRTATLTTMTPVSTAIADHCGG
jgi:hypothetical protein